MLDSDKGCRRCLASLRKLSKAQRRVPTGGPEMSRKSAMAFFALIFSITISTAPRAQDIKLYAFSSGALTIGKGALVNFAPMEPTIQVPVGFYVIKHPKGNVLFDTGNNDKIIKDP